MPANVRIRPAVLAAFIALDLVIVGVVLIALFWVAPAPPAFAQGQTLAQAQRAKPTGLSVAVITADWCFACQMYKRGPLADARVTSWLEEHAGTTLLVHGEHDADIEAVGVEGLPATVIMTGSSVLAAHIGLMSAEELLEFLESNRVRALEAGAPATPDAEPSGAEEPAQAEPNATPEDSPAP